MTQAPASPVRTAPPGILTGPIIPTMLRLALPTIVVLVVQTLVGVAETYFVSFLGAPDETAPPVTAVTPIWPAWTLPRRRRGPYRFAGGSRPDARRAPGTGIGGRIMKSLTLGRRSLNHIGAALAALMLIAATCGTAAADGKHRHHHKHHHHRHHHGGVFLNFGTPGYYAPRSHYYHPAPRYYYPPPVYYVPRPSFSIIVPLGKHH